jgi:quercetin dioxygenase-like cupin family protein
MNPRDQESARVLDLRSVFGLQARITTAAAATQGEYVEMDVTAEPGAATMLHSHPGQTETYRVLEGTLEVFRSEDWFPLRAGESFTVPPSAVHGFRNTTHLPVRFMNEHRPALGFEDHLTTLDRLVRAGKIKGTKDVRSLIYMSMSAIRHRPDVPVKPPLWVLHVMAFFGRRLGYTLE